jgi:hypothetical protein
LCVHESPGRSQVTRPTQAWADNRSCVGSGQPDGKPDVTGSSQRQVRASGEGAGGARDVFFPSRRCKRPFLPGALTPLPARPASVGAAQRPDGGRPRPSPLADRVAGHLPSLDARFPSCQCGHCPAPCTDCVHHPSWTRKRIPHGQRHGPLTRAIAATGSAARRTWSTWYIGCRVYKEHVASQYT